MPQNRHARRRIALLLTSSCVIAVHASLPSPAAGQTASHDRLNASFARLPLHFEANAGQTDERVKFLARGRGYTVFLTPAEAVLTLNQTSTAMKEVAVVRMKFAGAGGPPAVTGREKLRGVANYFVGNDRTAWRTHVPTYAQVRYASVYPGVDVVYYGRQQQVEYDIVVSPGADIERIALEFDGADAMDVDAAGGLVLDAGGVHVRMRKPRIFQHVDGRRKAIAGRYALTSSDTGRSHRVRFQIDEYDGAQPLVIDPVLVLDYSTLLGGSDAAGAAFTSAEGIAVDASGSSYVTGATSTVDFPVRNAVQSTLRGATDAFIAKIDAAGTGLGFCAPVFDGDRRRADRIQRRHRDGRIRQRVRHRTDVVG